MLVQGRKRKTGWKIEECNLNTKHHRKEKKMGIVKDKERKSQLQDECQLQKRGIDYKKNYSYREGKAKWVVR